MFHSPGFLEYGARGFLVVSSQPSGSFQDRCLAAGEPRLNYQLSVCTEWPYPPGMASSRHQDPFVSHAKEGAFRPTNTSEVLEEAVGSAKSIDYVRD